MKKLFLLGALVVTGLAANAQGSQNQVPAEVSSALTKKYPDAKNIDWEREGVNHKAEFSMGKKDYEVLFDSKGQWVSTNVDDIPTGELPQEVQMGIDNSAYKNWEVRDIESTESPNETTYKLEVRSGLKMRDLYIDEKGNIIRDKSRI